MTESIIEIRSNINSSFVEIERLAKEREEREKAERDAKWKREEEERIAREEAESKAREEAERRKENSTLRKMGRWLKDFGKKMVEEEE